MLSKATLDILKQTLVNDFQDKPHCLWMEMTPPIVEMHDILYVIV